VNPTDKETKGCTSSIYHISSTPPHLVLDAISVADIKEKLQTNTHTANNQRIALSLNKPIEFIRQFCNNIASGNTPVVLNPKLPTLQTKTLAEKLRCQQLVTNDGTYQYDARGSIVEEKSSLPLPHHVFCSSGTSTTKGLPKSFTYALNNSIENAAAHMTSLNFVRDGGNKILLPMPISHSFGMMAGVLGATEYNAELYIAPESLNSQGILHVIEKYGIDSLYLTPSHMAQLFKFLKRKRNIHIPTLERISIGSSVVIASELLSLMQFFPDTNFYTTYGLTELGPRVSTFYAGRGNQPNTALNKYLDQPTPLGSPLKGVQLQIKDNQLVVKSPFQAISINNGQTHFFNTCDHATLDEQHNIRVLGRSDDTIIRAGVNIYPSEIESKLTHFEDISGLCLVGLASKTYGEVPILICELTSTSRCTDLEKMILTHLKTVLPDTHIPAQIIFLEKMPRTALGKIKRSEISQRIKDKSLG